MNMVTYATKELNTNNCKVFFNFLLKTPVLKLHQMFFSRAALLFRPCNPASDDQISDMKHDMFINQVLDN